MGISEENAQVARQGFEMSNRLQLANAIRALSMDAVQKANSGHPGMPMGMADIAEVLWNDFLSHDPAQPLWPNRDRFVLSNGHGSMLLYSLLHLSGYELSIADLQNFRQFGSKTPGHPEYGITPGVETTTGPLGQGFANSIGMALAEKILAAEFNREGFPLVDHYTYVFVGDGCLMEGISQEAASLAGTLGLNKLVVLYDDNNISIDGEVHDWFADDTPARFEACGWQVVRKVDGHNPTEIRRALETARKSADKPTLICCKTIIGWGSPAKQGKESSHGAPLGNDEIKATREFLNWPYAAFEIPESVAQAWDARAAGAKRSAEWNALLTRYAAQYPELAAEFTRRTSGRLPADWAQTLTALYEKALAADKPVATRKASQNALNVIAPKLPELFGGSADLSESNCTLWSGAKVIKPHQVQGNYLSWGVREFAMGAAMNGVTLHAGLLPYGGTFLTFSDYARNAIRMAALMKIGTVFVFTHDSIGLGEDGPTHQPVEHLATLRLIPNVETWRPCDAFETAVAWQAAVERRDGPTLLALSRQNLPPMPHSTAQVQAILTGAYAVYEPASAAAAVILATGSEVTLAVDAAKAAAAEGLALRVVSVPCAERFLKQPKAAREALLPVGVPRLAVEAGVTHYWRALVGDQGDVLGIDSFGESAPAGVLFEHFGFSVAEVLGRVKALLK
jgi:transketolase